MRIQSPFASHLLNNLRLSFLVTVLVLGIVAAYSLIAHTEPDWQIVIFVAIGMALSSIINALFDVRRDHKPDDGPDAK